jgi:hypothetical protein
MVALAIMCVGVALQPQRVVRALSTVADELLGDRGVIIAAAAPLDALARLNAAIWVVSILVGAAVAFSVRRGRAVSGTTWGCGYARPNARMQYTAAGFSEMLSEWLIPKSIRPRVSTAPPSTLFPRRAEFSSDRQDPMTRALYEPSLARWADRFARLRWMQQGMLHIYLVYVLVALLVGLAWSTIASWSAG